MAIKTFTTGEVLTAADTNTYLANSGLVCLGTTTFSGSSNAAANGVFSSAYTNYRVVFYATRSTTNQITMRLRIGTTDNTDGTYANQYARINDATWYAAAQNLTAFDFNGTTNASSLSVTFDILNPYAATQALMSGQCVQGLYASQSANSMFWGRKADSNQYTGLNFIPSTGTLTGTITVYGYREA